MNDPVQMAREWKKLPPKTVLRFERYTLQHSDKYVHGKAALPCGCPYCVEDFNSPLNAMKRKETFSPTKEVKS